MVNRKLIEKDTDRLEKQTKENRMPLYHPLKTTQEKCQEKRKEMKNMLNRIEKAKRRQRDIAAGALTY